MLFRSVSQSRYSDAATASQKADEAKASAKLADDVVNCVPIAWVVDNFTSTDTDHPLSANAGRLLNNNKVDKVEGKGLVIIFVIGNGSLILILFMLDSVLELLINLGLLLLMVGRY